MHSPRHYHLQAMTSTAEPWVLYLMQILINRTAKMKVTWPEDFAIISWTLYSTAPTCHGIYSLSGSVEVTCYHTILILLSLYNEQTPHSLSIAYMDCLAVLLRHRHSSYLHLSYSSIILLSLIIASSLSTYIYTRCNYTLSLSDSIPSLPPQCRGQPS